MRRAIALFAVAGATLMLMAGVALADTFTGDGGNDRLVGTDSSDKMYGRGGNDIIAGKRGSDLMRGGSGPDTLRGSYGKDRMYGGVGNETIYGGHYRDRIIGGPGKEWINADNGNDFVDVADGQVDSVSCGLGDDTIVVDAADVGRRTSFEDFVRQTSCEHLRTR